MAVQKWRKKSMERMLYKKAALCSVFRISKRIHLLFSARGHARNATISQIKTVTKTCQIVAVGQRSGVKLSAVSWALHNSGDATLIENSRQLYSAFDLWYY